MFKLLGIFKKKETNTSSRITTPNTKDPQISETVAVRKGEIGEYKIDIQLGQLPKENKYLSDLLYRLNLCFTSSLGRINRHLSSK